MFGTNEVGSYRLFEKEPPHTLMVTSIFHTIQGEGPFAGRPAVFIRLAKCNLQCSFCDTYFDKGDTLPFFEIELGARMSVQRGHFEFWENPLIVITGGEPMMQPNLHAFCEYLAGRFGKLTIQIETNGCFHQPLRPSVHVVCSPKINEKTGAWVYQKDALERADYLKFVISADVEAYNSIPAFAILWREQRPNYRSIYVSPMNCYLTKPTIPIGDVTLAERTEKERISFWTPMLLDMAANQRNHEHAADIAMRYNAILTLQMHLYAGLP